jgi:hypothetical protein
LKGCNKVPESYITKMLATVPELVVTNYVGKTVGGLRGKQLEARYSELAPDCDSNYDDVYGIIGQWELEGDVG